MTCAVSFPSVLLIASLWACGGAPLVDRAYDGHVVEGRAIEPEAYAAFLSGALAEASGDTHGALIDYERVARLDPDAPEIWSRIGIVRCEINPKDSRSARAFARALAIDGSYSGAWIGKSKCAAVRGDEQGMVDAARRAAVLDPSADAANVLLTPAVGAAPDAAARETLLALTTTARDRVAAWDALASWAEAHGDIALWTLALETVVRMAPARRETVAGAAEELAGAGQVGAARAVAAAAVDAGDGPLADEKHPLAARLAVDEAIADGNVAAVRLRATRSRVGLEEAAARAWLAGKRDLGHEIVLPLIRAYSGGSAARLVFAACDGRNLLDAAREAHPGAHASGAALIAFGTAVVRAASPRDARATLGAIAHDAMVAGDDLVIHAAVDLVSRGALGASTLPPDGLVELAALRGTPPAEGPSLADRSTLDARHEYLALAMADPKAARTKELAARLASVAGSDAVVAAAAAIVQIGTGDALEGEAARALLDHDPDDLLRATIALRIASRVGDTEVAARARATLTGFGARAVRDESSGPRKTDATF